MRNIFSYHAAYQHIEPNVTFHRCFGFTTKKILWFPYQVITAVIELVIVAVYTAMLMPLGYLCFWYRLAAEYLEYRTTQSKDAKP